MAFGRRYRSGSRTEVDGLVSKVRELEDTASSTTESQLDLRPGSKEVILRDKIPQLLWPVNPGRVECLIRVMNFRFSAMGTVN
jgi:hypothetical protein